MRLHHTLSRAADDEMRMCVCVCVLVSPEWPDSITATTRPPIDHRSATTDPDHARKTALRHNSSSVEVVLMLTLADTAAADGVGAGPPPAGGRG